MSGDCAAMSIKDIDLKMILACRAHIGTTGSDTLMEQYIFKAKKSGVYLINIRKMWEKLMLASRIIAAIENPADILVCSTRRFGERAISKFSHDIGTTPIAGRFVPGTFTNYIQKDYREPRLLIVSDPRADYQAVQEASYANVPIIALCTTDNSPKGIDICIPINNKAARSVGLAWWLMAREVLRLKGTISRQLPWTVKLDVYFYRHQAMPSKEDKRKAVASLQKEVDGDWSDPAPLGGDAVEDWAAESDLPVAPAAGGAPAALAAPKVEDWSAQPAVDDWSAQTGDWGGAGSENWA